MPRKIRLLIADDSSVFRSQIRMALEKEPEIEILEAVNNGQEACTFVQKNQVDILTLDLEMPVMDGISALKEMMKLGLSTKTIVFSSQTRVGAEATLEALKYGASDFVTKPSIILASQNPADVIRELLLPKILQFKDFDSSVGSMTKVEPPAVKENADLWDLFFPKVVVIASSTGGPMALEKLLSQVHGPLTVPILIVQHMPPVFTASLAERLSRVCSLNVHEASHGEPVLPNTVYIAPGDHHMRLQKSNDQMMISLDRSGQRNFVRPSADFLFESAAEHYKNKCLGIVLTGMGSDGKDGAVAIKKSLGGVIIQDQPSCVVFGMPGAVFTEGAYDRMGNLDQIAELLKKLGICQ